MGDNLIGEASLKLRCMNLNKNIIVLPSIFCELITNQTGIICETVHKLQVSHWFCWSAELFQCSYSAICPFLTRNWKLMIQTAALGIAMCTTTTKLHLKLKMTPKESCNSQACPSEYMCTCTVHQLHNRGPYWLQSIAYLAAQMCGLIEQRCWEEYYVWKN